MWKRVGLSLAAVVVLLAVVASLGWLVVSSTPVSPVDGVSAAAPTRTSQADGYFKTGSQTQQPNVGSVSAVSDSGAAAYIQVVSQGTAPAMTDLSRDGYLIYRLHSPKILKTNTGRATPLRSIRAVLVAYPKADLIMNASGYDMGGDGQAYGIQINNGKLLRDWSQVGLHYTFVINHDGSTAIYDSTSSAAQILAKGAWQSYSFGPAVLWNGRTVPDDGFINWEDHSWVGTDVDNNIFFLRNSANRGYYRDILPLAQSLKLTNLVELDSGGSVQWAVGGQVALAGDGRQMPDFFVVDKG